MKVYYKGVVDHRFNPTLTREFTVYDSGKHLLWGLSQGKEALIDYCDFELVKTLKWRAQKDYSVNEGTYYALSGGTTRNNSKENNVMAMHRVIACNPSTQVDHRNMDGLDNRRGNLRLATKVQQMFNQHRAEGGMSATDNYSCEFRGVTKRKDNGRFRVRAQGVDMLQNNIGHFSTGEAAAIAWDEFMYEEFKGEHPLEHMESNEIVGEPTINFIQFNFPERLGL